MCTADRGPLYRFVRPDNDHTLYDFQSAAVAHCVHWLTALGKAVLALDTGLGKTCVTRAVVDTLGARALVVVPGGLVRQVAAALERAPWEASASLLVARAETGRELATALAQAHCHHRVLVVNRALRFRGNETKGYTLLVVDEAHQKKSVAAVRKLGGMSRSTGLAVPTLCVSASPESCGGLPYLIFGRSWLRWPREEWDNITFMVRKTPRVLDILGVTRPCPVLLDLPLPDEEKYDTALLLCLLSRSHVPPSSLLRLNLAVGTALGRLRGACAQRARAVLDRADRDKLPPVLVADALAFVANGGVIPPGSNNRDAWGYEGSGVCPCCGLSPAERAALARVHASITPEPPPPWTHASLGVTSAIVRFPSRRELDDAVRRYPVPAPIAVKVLSSDKSAAYRGRLISQFASRDGQKANLAVLSRASQRGTAPELFLRVCALGMGTMLLKSLEQCLARPRLLLADATVDMGFDLHRHVDAVYVPRLPTERSTLQQLVGRVCRIAPERKHQGTLDVISHRYLNSVDDILWNHLKSKAGGEDDG